MLDGDAGMRPLVRDGRDDADLPVAPFDRADSGDMAQRRLVAVGGGDEPGAQARAVVERDIGAGFGRVRRGDAASAAQRKARQGAGAVEQHAAQDAVLDDIAERHCVVRASRDQLAAVVMQEQRRVVVGDTDFADRLGVRGDVRPQAERIEHQARAVGDRRGAPVKAAIEHRRGVLRIDDRRPEARRRRRRRRAASRSARLRRSAARHHRPCICGRAIGQRVDGRVQPRLGRACSASPRAREGQLAASERSRFPAIA